MDPVAPRLPCRLERGWRRLPRDLDSVLLADRPRPACRHAHRGRRGAKVIRNRRDPREPVAALQTRRRSGRKNARRSSKNAETIKPVEAAAGLNSADFNANWRNLGDSLLLPAISPIAGLFCPQRRSAVSLHTREATRPVPCVARHHEAHASRRSFVARERVLAERSIDGSRLSPTFPLRQPHKLRGHLRTGCSSATTATPDGLSHRGNRCGTLLSASEPSRGFV